MKASPEVHRARSAYAYAVRMDAPNKEDKRKAWISARLHDAIVEAREAGLSDTAIRALLKK